MIYEHFRATRAYGAVQGLSDLFNIFSQDGDVQDFDTRWDQALSAASTTPTENVLEGLYKSKLQDSVQLHTVLALSEQENIRNNEQPSYSRLKTSVSRHIDQTQRTRNFRGPERKSRKRSSNQESKREKSQRGEDWENAISGKQLDNVRKETHAVCVTMEHLETDAVKSADTD